MTRSLLVESQRIALVALLLIAGPVTAQDAETLRRLTPYLGDDSLLIGRLDVRNVDVAQMQSRFRKMGVEAASVDALGVKFVRIQERLLAAGAKHVYFTNDGILPQPDLLAVVPCTDAQAVAKEFADEPPLKTRIVGNVVLVGTTRSLENAGKRGGTPNPEWAKLLAKLESYPSYLAVLPPPTLRRVLVELQPILPADFGGGSMQALVDGVRWGALGADLSAKPSVEFMAQTKDEETAKMLEPALAKAIDFVKNRSEMSELPFARKLLDEHRPKRVGDRFVSALDAAAIDATLVPAAAALRQKAAVTVSLNQLRQIEIAMHNYQGTHRTLPPQMTVDKADRPLLSWRVLILPYIEQKALYDQFRLEEPWDSDHNKKLIAKMPALYRSPLSKTKPEDGLTTYLVPTGPKAFWNGKSFFNGKTTASLVEIPDGTSNTISIFDVDDSKAVTWTKPDDYPVAPKKAFLGHFRPEVGRILAAFFDGSVRMLSDRTPDETLWLYVCPNDGMAIPQEK
jgi:hypothetical protein